MNRTKIEWTDYTWNPVTGCLHGCEYCYARKITQRFKSRYPVGFAPYFHEGRLNEPRGLKAPAKIFVVSMGDLFGAWVPAKWQDAVFDVIDDCPQHTFQLLTKDPKTMKAALHRRYRWEVPDNVWYGTSVTCAGDETRCLSLPVIDGGKAFISFEPLLGPIDPKYSARGLIAAADWIIIGAQTNPTRLPDPAWVRDIIDAARDVGAKVFMKDSLAPIGLPMLREFPGDKEAGLL